MGGGPREGGGSLGSKGEGHRREGRTAAVREGLPGRREDPREGEDHQRLRWEL